MPGAAPPPPPPLPSCHLTLGAIPGDSSSQAEQGQELSQHGGTLGTDGSLTSPPGADHPHPRLEQPWLALSRFQSHVPPSGSSDCATPALLGGSDSDSVRIDAALAGRESLSSPGCVFPGRQIPELLSGLLKELPA